MKKICIFIVITILVSLIFLGYGNKIASPYPSRQEDCSDFNIEEGIELIRILKPSLSLYRDPTLPRSSCSYRMYDTDVPYFSSYFNAILFPSLKEKIENANPKQLNFKSEQIFFLHYLNIPTIHDYIMKISPTEKIKIHGYEALEEQPSSGMNTDPNCKINLEENIENIMKACKSNLGISISFDTYNPLTQEELFEFTKNVEDYLRENYLSLEYYLSIGVSIYFFEDFDSYLEFLSPYNPPSKYPNITIKLEK